MGTRIGFFVLLALSTVALAVLWKRVSPVANHRGVLIGCVVVQTVAGLGYPLTVHGVLPQGALTVDLLAQGAVLPYIELAWAEAYAMLSPKRFVRNVWGSLLVAAMLLISLHLLPFSGPGCLLPLASLMLLLWTMREKGDLSAQGASEPSGRACAIAPGFYLGMLFSLAAGNVMAGSAEVGGFISWTSIVVGTVFSAGIVGLGAFLNLRCGMSLPRFNLLIIGILVVCYVVSGFAFQGVASLPLVGRTVQHYIVTALEQSVCSVSLIMLLFAVHESQAATFRILAVGYTSIFGGKAIGSIVGMAVPLDPAVLSLSAAALFVPAVFFLAQGTGSFSFGRAPVDDESGAAQSERDEWERRVREIAESFGLSPREFEVLSLWARGHRLDYIAEQLCIAKNTAKTHVGHIYKKIGVANREELLQLMKKF